MDLFIQSAGQHVHRLSYSKIPGVIVETAFMSNSTERQLLTKDEFREQLAKAIADGVEHYLKESGEVLSP
ncbi:MAG: N-acetylmuramoyl-L-alanine amidase [Clostridiales bacterium]|nr:N-acetylmuramoyl-L-alanine amidase [Eubacteriales bacterium]MDH7565911.1 N-acetylmuramoyl-L-alanine amidase [Clostridiales bacterium]